MGEAMPFLPVIMYMEEFINYKFSKFPFPPTPFPAAAIQEPFGGDL